RLTDVTGRMPTDRGNCDVPEAENYPTRFKASPASKILASFNRMNSRDFLPRQRPSSSQVRGNRGVSSYTKRLQPVYQLSAPMHAGRASTWYHTSTMGLYSSQEMSST